MKNLGNKKLYIKCLLSGLLAAGAVCILFLAGKLSVFTAGSVISAFAVLHIGMISGRFAGVLLPASMAVITECIMQLMITNQYLSCLEYQRGIDLLLYFMVFCFLHHIMPGKGWGELLGTLLFTVIGTVNFLVTFYRGRPVYFPDLYSVSTAVRIIDLKGYTFPFSKVYMLSLLLAAAAILSLAGKSHIEDRRPYWKTFLIGMAPVLLVSCFVIFRIPDLLSLRSYYFSTTDYWMYSFAMSGYSMRVDRPEEYDSARIPITETSDSATDTEDQIRPNVLIIMNESFADLRHISDFEKEDRVMPFIDSMKEEPSFKEGKLYVSIFGGNTANTEFEMLTGISMYLLPSDTTAYNLYLNKKTISLADYFGQLGYRTIAFHPSKAANYNRNFAYPNLGFEETYFQEDYSDWEVLRNYTISDQWDYGKVLEFFQSKKEGEKLFLFNVTVQNHGPFDLEAPDLEMRVDLEKYPIASQYLSLLNYSDQAFEELIAYLKDYDEPTVVLMFGDHQAKIEDAFYEELLGKPLESLSLDGEMKRYTVPYYVWSNYGLEIGQCKDISANYLGAQLTEWLGLPQTAEYKFLNSMREKWPIITANGLSTNGLSFIEEADDELLGKYEQVGYNLLFDEENRWKELFILKE